MLFHSDIFSQRPQYQGNDFQKHARQKEKLMKTNSSKFGGKDEMAIKKHCAH